MSSGEKLAINCIGRAGVGKTTLTNRMAKEYGFWIFRPSDVIRDYAQKRGASLQYRSDYVKHHAEMLADDPKAILRPVMEAPNDLVWIDGLRVPAHAEQFRKQLGMYTLALDAPVEVRYRNIVDGAVDRQRNESHLTSLETFVEDERIDNSGSGADEPNIDLVMAMADYKIQIRETTTSNEVYRLAVTAVESWLRDFRK